MVDPASWGAGSYRDVAFGMLPIVSRLVAEASVRAGDRVLDVGCGSGTVAILAAQRGARVTGLDITPRMLELAREDAAIAGVGVDFHEGDAQKKPFADASFDVVLSNMGVIFAPDAQRAAGEMLRVLAPGGRLALTSWARGSPTDVVLREVAAATGASQQDDPFAWSEPAVVEARLGAGVRDLRIQRGMLARPTLSLGHWWRFTSAASPPVAKALAELDEAGRERLRARLVAAAAAFVHDGAQHGEYVLVTATRA